MTPPPPPLKLLNRICIDLKNDPNGSEKNGFPLKNGKIPCLHQTHENKYTGMRLGFGKNSGKFYVAIDSNHIQHHRF